MASSSVLGPQSYLTFLLRSPTVAQATLDTSGNPDLAEQELPTLPYERLPESRLFNLLGLVAPLPVPPTSHIATSPGHPGPDSFLHIQGRG